MGTCPNFIRSSRRDNLKTDSDGVHRETKMILTFHDFEQGQSGECPFVALPLPIEQLGKPIRYEGAHDRSDGCGEIPPT